MFALLKYDFSMYFYNRPQIENSALPSTKVSEGFYGPKWRSVTQARTRPHKRVPTRRESADDGSAEHAHDRKSAITLLFSKI